MNLKTTQTCTKKLKNKILNIKCYRQTSTLMKPDLIENFRSSLKKISLKFQGSAFWINHLLLLVTQNKKYENKVSNLFGGNIK